MKASVTAFVSGLLFSAGLLLSGMTQPSKVLGFLDVAGDWDPSLMFVMGGAIAVHFFFARRALRPGARPLFADDFERPSRTGLDARLIGGAAIFGVGWGLSGYCPGPALVSVVTLSAKTLAFVLAVVAGTLAMRRARPGEATTPPRWLPSESAPATPPPR
jgi:uncharacterized membrane protein YedE/YeeE